MNDKIKKLAEQAGCTYTMNNVITTKHNGIPIDVMEKFAKLIIKECGEIADDYVEFNLPSRAIDINFGIKSCDE
jgi:hypothetical protein